MTGRVVSPEEVVAAGERDFARSGGIDMVRLAEELRVSRATLYRVAGSRDRLLGDVLWLRGRRAFHAAQSRAVGAGVDRVVSLARTFNEAVVSDPAMQSFLRDDSASAFRVLFGPEARVHVRFVALWQETLAQEVAAQRLAPIDVEAMAFLVVRLGESILYGDLLVGRSPSLDLAETAQRAVLQAAVHALVV